MQKSLDMHFKLLNIPEIQLMKFDSVPVNLYRITFDGTIDTFSLNFKEGYNSYLNYGLHVTNKNISDLSLPEVLLHSPTNSSGFEGTLKLTQEQRYLYFLLVNGNRDLRKITESVTYRYVEFFKNDLNSTIVYQSSLYVLQLLLVLIIIVLFLVFTTKTERTKIEIIKIYEGVEPEDIKTSTLKCYKFLETFQG